MGRRKSTNVQRNKRLRTDEGSAADAERNSGDRSDASNEPLSSHAQHRAKARRRNAGFAVDPLARIWDRVVLQCGDNAPLQLTFRDAWTPLYRNDALWLEWQAQLLSLQSECEGVTAAAALRIALHEAISSDVAHRNGSDDTVVGLELHAPDGSIALRTANGPAVATSLTLEDVFPTANAAWRAHVAHLVATELLVVELVCKRRQQPQSTSNCSNSIAFDTDRDVRWRVGVAWRVYSERHDHASALQLAPARGVSVRRSVHVVMLWLLTTVRDGTAATAVATASGSNGDDDDAVRTTSAQCTYAYWDEIDVLYKQAVAGTSDREAAAAPAIAFDIHDVYARIDATRQLQRDTRTVDAALARHTGGSALLPTLRPYQRAAVSWMLARETASSSATTQQLTNASPTNTLVQFPLARARATGSMSWQLAYDPFRAQFEAVESAAAGKSRRPSFAAATWLDAASVRGGILADEMGLGKTVEVIALLLCHPWPAPRPLLCSHHVAQDVSASDDGGDDDDDDIADAVELRDCICGSSDDEPLGWVQCDFCSSWHHQLCTGYRAATSSEQFDVVADAAAAPNANANAFCAGMFMCFHCQSVQRPTFACKTTLIVSPEAIADQWETELRRHVRPGALSLLRYDGVRAVRARLPARPSADWQVLATAGLHMATYDVVLTTYEALSADVAHVPTDALHARRTSTRQHRKRYAFVASPLLLLRFWRVCTDEAQVGVENTQRQAAVTAAQLRSDLTWIVTGTPLSTQLGDLFGCFRYLRLAPFGRRDDDRHGDNNSNDSQHFFRAVIERCFARGASDRVLDLLLWDGASYEQQDSRRRRRDGGGLLWRTNKRDVLAQLALPPQTSDVVWCRFSAVERHFYDEQERAIVAAVRDASNSSSSTSCSSSDVAEHVWSDLLVLRQICCHPQIGNSSITTGSSDRLGSSAVLSMDAFLQELLAKCVRECEDAQRQLLAAQNGLAALRIVTHETPAAVRTYVAALCEVETNWPLFRADLLPRLHVLENLAQCVRRVLQLDAASSSNDTDDNAVTTAVNVATANPKEQSLVPALPALKRALSSVIDSDGNDDLSDDALRRAAASDTAAIARECAALDACAQRIRQFYLLQVEAAHAAALRAFESAASAVDAHTTSQRVLCSRSLWWLEALAALDAAQSDTFADRVRARLLALGSPWATRFVGQFATAAGFRVAFVAELEALAARRTRTYAALRTLSTQRPTEQDIARSGNCRKCRDGRDGPVCAHCTLYRDLEALRLHLLGVDGAAVTTTTSSAPTRSSRSERRGRATGIYDDNDDGDGGSNGVRASTGGSGAATSLLLEVFREVASSARMAKSSTSQLLVQDALRDELEFWPLVQREWTAAKRLLQAQHQRLGALDELAMATLQLRVRHEYEVVETAAERLYKLEPHDVPIKLATLDSDRVVAELELRAHSARLRFLQQMARQSQQQSTVAMADGNASSDDAATCAVCLEALGDDRAMLRCAHAFCTGCAQQLARAASRSLRCPTCRRVSSTADVVVVRARCAHEQLQTASLQRPLADTHIALAHGGFGAKADAIVRRVLALAQQDPQLKCLLFTQWQPMLALVATHLQRHGVACFPYAGKRAFQRDMTRFRRCAEPCVLALPFKVGANGLNLVEATDVLLVEPLLNASIEAQAVNRVHRIGQTRQTRVHRFVVVDSVDERIYWLGQQRRTSPQSGASESLGDRSDRDATAVSDDAAASNGVARAPSKKEKETLTLDDLHVLLDGRAVTSDTNGDGDVDAEASRHPFWHEQVLLNGKTHSRATARKFIERLHAAQTRADGERQQGLPPLTRLFGDELSVVVAHEVAHLPLARARSAFESPQTPSISVSAELLELHRTRLVRELDVWRSSE